VDFVLSQQTTLYNGNIVMLPLWPYLDHDLDSLKELAKATGSRFFMAKDDGDGKRTYIAVQKDQTTLIPFDPDAPPTPITLLKPLLMLPVRGKDLIHPELALCGAKMGLDLIVAIEESMASSERFLVSMRPIDQLAVAFCARNGAAVGLIPEGHAPGRGANCAEEASLTYTLDVRDWANKRFQDRIDFPALFADPDHI
jgi:hypothetical protein